MHRAARTRVDDPAPVVVRQAVAQLAAVDRQFSEDAAIAAIVRHALTALEQLEAGGCADVCTTQIAEPGAARARFGEVD